MADIASELNYLRAHVELNEGEELLGTYGGNLKGAGFDDWEGILVATNFRLICSSEPGFSSNGLCAWFYWQSIRSLEQDEISFAVRFHPRGQITFVCDDGSDLAELAQFVEAQLREVVAEPAIEAFQRGLAAMERQDCAAAVAAFTEASRLDPRSPLPDMNRAEALLGLDRYDEALAAAAVSTERGCTNAQYLANVTTRAHFFKGELPEAEREARRALEVGESLIARQFLCFALRDQGKYLDALTAAEEGVQAFPQDEPLAMQPVALHLALGDTAGAASALEHLERLDGVDARSVQAFRGRLLALRGEHEKAVELLLELYRDAGAWEEFDAGLMAAEALVDALDALKRPGPALEFLDRLRAAVDDRAPCVALWRANFLHDDGRHVDAAQAVWEALEKRDQLRPEQQLQALLIKGRVANATGDHPTALRASQEARELMRGKDFNAVGARQVEHFLAATEAEALISLGRHAEAPPLLRVASRSANADLLEQVRKLQDRLHEVRTPAVAAPAPAPAGQAPGRPGPSLSGRRDETLPLLKQLQERLAVLPGQEALRDEARRLREDYGRAVILAVMGEFNAGKSTFINALIGQDLLPTDVLPTTATINVLRWGERPGARIVWQDGSVEEIAMERLRQYVAEQKEAKENAVLRKIRLVEISVPQEVLKRTWIVDTPGLNAIIPEHAEVTREFMKQADAVVWLFRADQTGKKSELDALGMAGAYASKTLGVVNHMDRVPRDEAEELLDGVRQDFGSLLGSVVGISARRALEARLAKDRARWEASGFPALIASLQRVVFAQSRPLKAASTLKKALGLISQVEALEKAAADRHELRMKATGELKALVSERSRLLGQAIQQQRGRVAHAVREASGELATRMLQLGGQRGWNISDADVRYLNQELHGRLGPCLAGISEQVASQAGETLAQVDRGWNGLDVADGAAAAAWQRFSIESTARLREHELSIRSVSEYVRGRLDAGDLRAIAQAAAQAEGGASQGQLARLVSTSYAFIADGTATASSAWSETFHAAAADAIEQAEETLREQHVQERQERFRPALRLREPLQAALAAVPASTPAEAGEQRA